MGPSGFACTGGYKWNNESSGPQEERTSLLPDLYSHLGPTSVPCKAVWQVNPRLIWELGWGWESVTRILGTLESSFVAGADDLPDK